MPYIPKDQRIFRDNDIKNLSDKLSAPGQLNYVITKLCIAYLKFAGPSYSSFNEIVGVLECAKMEFYRRACIAYENRKIKENGDVY